MNISSIFSHLVKLQLYFHYKRTAENQQGYQISFHITPGSREYIPIVNLLDFQMHVHVHIEPPEACPRWAYSVIPWPSSVPSDYLLHWFWPPIANLMGGYRRQACSVLSPPPLCNQRPAEGPLGTISSHLGFHRAYSSRRWLLPSKWMYTLIQKLTFGNLLR